MGDGHAQRGVNQFSPAGAKAARLAWGGMDRNRPEPLAGGCLFAFALIAGVAIGSLWGQASIGFLAGLGAGLVLLLATWLWQRPRR